MENVYTINTRFNTRLIYFPGESDGRDTVQETATYRDSNRDLDDDGDSDSLGDDQPSTTDDNAIPTCPYSDFHHSFIPRRRHSFLFSNLHTGQSTLSGCSAQCCKLSDCVLAFIVADTCYGVICNGDGGCHTLSDRLPRRSIFVTTVTRGKDIFYF